MDRFLTGTVGSKRVISLAQTLNKQTASAISEKFPTPDPFTRRCSFRPWMTCTRRVEYFMKNAPSRLRGTDERQQAEIIHATAELEFLHQALCHPENGNLEYVRSDFTDWRIMPSNNSDLPRFIRDMHQAKNWLCASGDAIGQDSTASFLRSFRLVLSKAALAGGAMESE